MKKISKKTTNNKQLKLTKKLVLFVMPIILFLLVALIIPKENIIKTTARKLFSGNTPIKEVEITTEDYDNEGSIKVTKEAHWVSKTEAELDLKLETIRKTGDNKKDIILVFDVSGSMEGEKLDKVKEDASELINYVLDKDEDNKVGLITFASESRIISPLSNNKEELIETINSISTEDSTNYYLAYKSIEEMLADYNKETGKDLVVLFMTDGSPTENAGATKGVYDSLKEQHPYMTLNAVEYEKGKTASDTQDISDEQWIANMDTLNNVLFEATVSPESYEKLSVIDYIDDEHFEIETNTPTKGSITVDNNKITWRFANNSYITGTEETLKIRLKLKEEYKDIKGLYQTNKKTEIKYKINTEKETTSTLTPVLKNNYDVIYDINAPETCNLEEIEGENHFIYDIVTIKNIEPKCTGYQLKGWQIEERDVKYKSEDKFIMPEEDVHIKAIWARQTMKAYMDGTVHEKTTLYKTIESDDVKTGAAKLYTGEHQDSLTVPGTENIYYYNGNVTTNNVIFAGFCWQIVRTTDTGGIKLIYNGVSNNGICNNGGTAQQIGTSRYSISNNSLAYVGYMYNTTYSSLTNTFVPQTTALLRVVENKTHYFAKNYEYNQSVSNRYKLYNNPNTENDDIFTAEECIVNGNCNEVLTGTYTFSNTNPDYSNATIRYVVGVVGEYIYYLELKNGQTLDDVNPTFYVGNGYEHNSDGTYTIKNENDTEISLYKKSEWITKYPESKNKYICIGSNPCIDPIYTTATTIQAYKDEKITNNYLYGNDFDYVLNETTQEYEYVLKDTEVSNKMQFWDWHNKYNQIKNNHYTCFNTTGRCNEIKYIYYTDNTKAFYMIIKNGKNINDVLSEMLTANNVNSINSIIKSFVDTWYEEHLTQYSTFLEDSVFCNDRSISSFGGFNPNGGNVNGQLIFSTNNDNRWDLSCINETDRFSTKNEKAKLVYPIGLISSDEIRLAYKGKSTNTYYLRPNSGNWINSPRNFPSIVYGDGNNINVFHLYNSGSLGNGNPVNYGAVRPVISLKPEIEYTDGDGTVNNPYIIDTTE